MKKALGKSLIFIGTLLIFITLYTNIRILRENDGKVENYKEIVTNKSSSKSVNNVDSLKDVVGVINIPKLDVEVIINEGTDEETLKKSVGHYEGTAMPGDKGNCVIAGHRNYTHNRFFSNLDRLEKEDIIYIQTLDETYKYKVTETKIVDPGEVTVLGTIDENKKNITLITCTPKFVGSHRLIVVGEEI